MRFEWDDAKSDRCLQERGFSFVDVIPAFADPDRRAEVDNRWDYGETRYTLYGRVEGRLFVVIYTVRDRAGGRPPDHLGSHKANVREMKRYDEGTSEG